MEQSGADILKAFEIHRDHCLRLWELSRDQQDLIQSGQYTQLIELLQHKQEVLRRLLDNRTVAHQRILAWHAVREQLPNVQRQTIEKVIVETEQLLAAISQNEMSCTACLEEHRDQTAAQLKKLSQGTNAHSAYQNGLGTPQTSRINLVH